MKTYKKYGIGLGVFLLALATLGIFMAPKKALAATSLDQAFAGCVENVINVVQKGNSGDSAEQCKLDDKNGYGNLIYATNAVQTIQNGNFEESTNTRTVTSAGVTITVPNSLILLDQNNKALVFANEKQTQDYESVDFGNASNTSQYYSDTNIFEVYYPHGGDHSFAFLTTITNGTLKVLAVVNTKVESGSPDYVYAASINKAVEGRDATGAPTATATAGCTATSGSSSQDCGGATQQGDDDTCSLKSNGATLAWIMCPTLEMMDALATNLMGLFENQLNFCVDHGGVTCAASPNNNVQKGDYCVSGSDCSNGVCQKTDGACAEGSSLGSGQDEVKTAWTAIKDLASAVIVIVLLIMVFSQALGSGPFEAYTVRKMLPRLVAAVILIQISWYLCAFIVDIFNDIGNGLADLLYAPFGGPSQLDFGSLLANANIGSGSGFFISYIGGVAAIALGVAFLPTVIFGALVGVLTLLAGLAVLMFRKILIILLIMLSPLAIVAWVLPGQGVQSLWKKWQDNFTKVLTMFPLVVAIIAAGRIFAYVVGSTKNGTFLNFWFVIAGYFLPLFILPRAYKWGGSILSAAGNQIGSLQTKAQSAAKEPIKGWVREKATDKWANNYNPLKKTLGSRRLSSALQSIKGGRVIPTSAAKAKMLYRGQQWSSTMADRNDALRNNFVRRVQEQGMPADMVRKYDKLAREKYGLKGYDKDGNDTGHSGIFSDEELAEGMRPNAVGSGKKASQVMAMMATEKNDSELLKSIARYNVQSKSLLELADKNFVFPQMDPVTKKYKMVPFWDWRPLVDQTFKDPSMWSELGGMRPDLTPNNVPRGGARYQKILAMAGFNGKKARDVNGREFEVGYDTAEDSRYVREFTNPDGSLHYRPYLMQKLQALQEDTQGIVQKGGNTLLTFANEITGWSKDGGYYGEGKSTLPSEEFANFIVKQAGTEAGLHALSNLKSTPSHVEAIDKALRASGITQFRAADGEIHDLNVDNLFEYNERAFKRMSADKDYVPAESELVRPGAHPSRDDEPPAAPGNGHPDDEPPPAPTPTPRTPSPSTPPASPAPAPSPTSPSSAATAPEPPAATGRTAPATSTASASTATTGGASPTVEVDLGSAGAHFDRLARAAEAMNEAAYHMRRTAATQERAARRIEGLQPDGTMNVRHDDEDDNQGNNPGQNP